MHVRLYTLAGRTWRDLRAKCMLSQVAIDALLVRGKGERRETEKKKTIKTGSTLILRLLTHFQPHQRRSPVLR